MAVAVAHKTNPPESLSSRSHHPLKSIFPLQRSVLRPQYQIFDRGGSWPWSGTAAASSVLGKGDGFIWLYLVDSNRRYFNLDLFFWVVSGNFGRVSCDHVLEICFWSGCQNSFLFKLYCARVLAFSAEYLIEIHLCCLPSVELSLELLSTSISWIISSTATLNAKISSDFFGNLVIFSSVSVPSKKLLLSGSSASDFVVLLGFLKLFFLFRSQNFWTRLISWSS